MHSYLYFHSRRRQVHGVLEVAVISSDCVRAQEARNRPFAGPDEVPGLESGDSNGSCIVFVGGTGTTSERVACIPIVKIHHVTRAS